MRNPYDVLGVTTSSTQAEIKNAYRKLAKKHHPDLNPNNKKNEDLFKEITSAYDLIGTSESKAKFDSGETDPSGAGAYSSQNFGGRGGGGFSNQSFDFDDDIISSLFGGAGLGGATRGGKRRGRRGGATFSMPGEDITYKMEVEFKDAILGAEKTLKLPGGKVLQTKIPPGFKSGQKLRFAGQGGAGMGGAPYGDLYVEVTVLPSKQFTRNEQNIESDLMVSFADALLGGDVAVPTVDGSVILHIPKHSNTGTRLRIRGKGVATSKGERGDHIVKLAVVLPDPPDPKLDELVKDWIAGDNKKSEAEQKSH